MRSSSRSATRTTAAARRRMVNGLRQISSIEGGHRYFYLMCLAIYAYKCDVPKQQLRPDMRTAFEDLQMVKHENALTEEDIRSALEAYDKEYYLSLIHI